MVGCGALDIELDAIGLENGHTLSESIRIICFEYISLVLTIWDAWRSSQLPRLPKSTENAKSHVRSVEVSRSQNPAGKDIASVYFLAAFGRGQWIRLFLCVIFEARNASELTPGIAKFSIHFLN